MVNPRFMLHADPDGAGWKIHEALNVEALELLQSITGIPASTWSLDVLRKGCRVFLFARLGQPLQENFVVRAAKEPGAHVASVPSSSLAGQRYSVAGHRYSSWHAPGAALKPLSILRCADASGQGAMAPVSDEAKKKVDYFFSILQDARS